MTHNCKQIGKKSKTECFYVFHHWPRCVCVCMCYPRSLAAHQDSKLMLCSLRHFYKLISDHICNCRLRTKHITFSKHLSISHNRWHFWRLRTNSTPPLFTPKKNPLSVDPLAWLRETSHGQHPVFLLHVCPPCAEAPTHAAQGEAEPHPKVPVIILFRMSAKAVYYCQGWSMHGPGKWGPFMNQRWMALHWASKSNFIWSLQT